VRGKLREGKGRETKERVRKGPKREIKKCTHKTTSNNDSV
jgi:hypothetical protein